MGYKYTGKGETFLYYLKIGVYYKIGLAKDIAKRFDDIEYQLIKCWHYDCSNKAFKDEQYLLNTTKQYKLKDPIYHSPIDEGYSELRRVDVIDIIEEYFKNGEVKSKYILEPSAEVIEYERRIDEYISALIRKSLVR